MDRSYSNWNERRKVSTTHMGQHTGKRLKWRFSIDDIAGLGKTYATMKKKKKKCV